MQYVIMIPTVHNDGTPVDKVLIGLTYDELAGVWKGLTMEDVRGRWMSDPEEQNLRLTVDVPDGPEADEFFRVYKVLLRIRFKQDAIYMVKKPVAGVPEFEPPSSPAHP